VLLAGFGIALALDGGERAEEEIASVGQDGGATRGDAVLREEQEKFGEKLIDVGGGVEFSDVGGEFVSEIHDRVGGRLEMGVGTAEKGRSGRERQAAAASSEENMATAGQILRIAGLMQIASHVSLLAEMGCGIYTRYVFANLLKMRDLQQKSADECENTGT
jgi:hypothetical protein